MLNYIKYAALYTPLGILVNLAYLDGSGTQWAYRCAKISAGAHRCTRRRSTSKRDLIIASVRGHGLAGTGGSYLSDVTGNLKEAACEWAAIRRVIVQSSESESEIAAPRGRLVFRT